jgi:hypothetical protein
MENKGVTQIPILRDTTTTWNYFSGKLLLCRYYLSEKGVLYSEYAYRLIPCDVPRISSRFQ